MNRDDLLIKYMDHHCSALITDKVFSVLGFSFIIVQTHGGKVEKAFIFIYLISTNIFKMFWRKHTKCLKKKKKHHIAVDSAGINSFPTQNSSHLSNSFMAGSVLSVSLENMDLALEMSFFILTAFMFHLFLQRCRRINVHLFSYSVFFFTFANENVKKKQKKTLQGETVLQSCCTSPTPAFYF